MSARGRSARFRGACLAIGLLAGLAALSAVFLARALTDPARMQTLLGAFWEGWEVQVEDIEVLPTSRPLDPSSWRLAVVGVALIPPDGTAPAWELTRLHLGLPKWRVLWSERRLSFRHARLVGLRTAPGEPPMPRLPAGLRGLEVEHLELWGADLHWMTDPSHPPVHLGGITGELLDVGWDPTGGWRADGRFQLRSATGSGFAVHGARVRSFALREGTVWFDLRTALAGGEGRLRGEITGLPQDPALTASMDLSGARLAETIWRTTKHDPPGDGKLDAALVWTLLPDQPPTAEGSVRVTRTRIPLGVERGPMAAELLRWSPHVRLADGELVVEEAHGSVEIEGPSVRMEGLRARTGRRDLDLRGELSPEHRRLVIRALPGRQPDQRAGFGWVLEGDEVLRLRLADKEDLLPPRAPNREARTR